jgi:RNA-binding protein YhbY
MMMIYQKYIYSNLLLLILIVTVSSLLFHIKPLNYNVNYYNRIQRIHIDNISKRYMINNENIVENNNNNDIIKKWTNPLYEEEEVNKWFVDVGKSLLTIGSKGVTKSQINSLSELLKQHKRVRVKMANDKMDTKTISNEMINDEILLNKVEILQIRSREFFLQSKQ